MTLAVALFGALTLACGQSTVAPETVGADVGPEGGEFEIDGVKVVVPAGALDKTTYLTLKKLPPKHDAEFAVELGPKDVVFNKPVNVSYVAKKGTDVAGLKAASWYGGYWRPLAYRAPYYGYGVGADVYSGCRIGFTRGYGCGADWGGPGYWGGVDDVDIDVDIDDDDVHIDYDIDYDRDFDCDNDCDFDCGDDCDFDCDWGCGGRYDYCGPDTRYGGHYPGRRGWRYY